MKLFKEFLDAGKVVKQSKDPAEARALFRQANDRFVDLKGLPLNEGNASFRFEDAYECLREALQAFLALEGYKSYSHEALFSFGQEKVLLTEAQSMKADRYREIRNDIILPGEKGDQR